MKMKYIIGFIAIVTIYSCSTISSKQELQDVKDALEVSFYTTDSIQIYGDFYKVGKEAKTIILFHQARSNARGEYESIANRLYEKGYNVLAIDQRSGGQLYGSYNRTIANFEHNNYSYCDAYSDLSAAIDYVATLGFEGKKIIWGSSYSAALVIKLGAERPNDVRGVLAFSPASGDPMDGCSPETYFEQVKVPLLVLRPDREAEYESVKAQLKSVKSFGFSTYIAENGVHGSSMLVESRTNSNTDKTWEVVEDFIENL